MNPNPADADLPDLMGHWAVRLHEPPAHTPPAPPPPPAGDSPPPLFSLDVPPRDFQPRLNRFDEAA